MTYIALLDDCGFQWKGISPTPVSSLDGASSNNLDEWFWQWAQKRRNGLELQTTGVFLIHAHACFTRDVHRQDMQGVELLKHIRLTPWLGNARSWHAIVYSFEPLEQVLARKPGNLILKSPGVTFLRLPDALDLESALKRAYPAKDWNTGGLDGVLDDLATNHCATPDARSFRPYVASDYQPPDSAHQISNWWGVYELRGVFSGHEYPEFDKPEAIPTQILPMVLRLDTKKARWLEGARASPPNRQASLPGLFPELERLIDTARNKKVAYLDDEADKGWLDLLVNLLNRDALDPKCLIVRPDPSKLQLPDKARQPDDYESSVKCLSRWVANWEKPDLLVLDLRLLGSREASQDPMQASGMDLAREVRRRNPYLPILLFTASNKAETLLISRSLDVDDYWMKPGLGEHRGLGTREEDLGALVAKLGTLLGPDYQWLQRAAGVIRAIEKNIKKTKKPSEKINKLWWQSPYHWPGPNGKGNDTQQPANAKIVSELLHAVLYTARMLFRFRQVFGKPTSAGHSPYAPPEMAPRILQTALFNQIGQVVEFVHGVSEASQDPYGGKTGSARIGGYFDQSTGQFGQFVFRRCDWWAFRLFALRNRYSHAGSLAATVNDDDVRAAISDLLAWLIVSPPRGVSNSGPYRLGPSNNRASAQCKGPSGRDAESDEFRQGLATQGYKELVKRSDEIQKGSP